MYKLTTIIGTRTTGFCNKWSGIVFSRHHGSYNGWWFDEKEMKTPIQLDHLPENLPYNDKYTVAYVRVDNHDIQKIRDKFLQNIGGQTHVQCSRHKLPLIASSTRSNKCPCGKKEFYRCCNLSCNTFLCKKCYESMDINSISFVNPRNNAENMERDEEIIEEDNEHNNDDNDTVDTNDTDNELIEPYRIPFDSENFNEEDDNNYDDIDDVNIPTTNI